MWSEYPWLAVSCVSFSHWINWRCWMTRVWWSSCWNKWTRAALSHHREDLCVKTVQSENYVDSAMIKMWWTAMIPQVSADYSVRSANIYKRQISLAEIKYLRGAKKAEKENWQNMSCFFFKRSSLTSFNL